MSSTRAGRPLFGTSSLSQTPVPITDFYKKYSSQDRRQLSLDLEITKLLVRANLPFSLVEHPAFSDFVTFCDRKALVKARTTFSR